MRRLVAQILQTERRWQAGLGLLILPTWFFLPVTRDLFIYRHASQAHGESSSPLEIRLVKAPQWKKGCLSITLDRINHSSLPLFLPDMGLYISTSVKEVQNDAKERDGVEWINVYGASDIVSFEASAIAPGATVHENGCLPPGVFVVNLKKETRREIPLRGRLRIDAYYFLTEKDWLQNKSYHDELLRTPPDQWDKLLRQDPKVVTIFTGIPCRDVGCKSGCDGDPPLILHGEQRIIPDVFYLHTDWGERGKKVSDELALKSPTCSEPRAAPR